MDPDGGTGKAMSKTKLELQHDGRIARVILAAPKANILDGTMTSELDSIFESLETRRDLRAIVLEAEGPHFSFGASVEEHLPEQIQGALARLSVAVILDKTDRRLRFTRRFGNGSAGHLSAEDVGGCLVRPLWGDAHGLTLVVARRAVTAVATELAGSVATVDVGPQAGGIDFWKTEPAR